MIATAKLRRLYLIVATEKIDLIDTGREFWDEVAKELTEDYLGNEPIDGLQAKEFFYKEILPMLSENNFGFDTNLIERIRKSLLEQQIEADETNCDLLNTESQQNIQTGVQLVTGDVITVGRTISQQSSNSSREYVDATESFSSVDELHFVATDAQQYSQQNETNHITLIDPLSSQEIPAATSNVMGFITPYDTPSSTNSSSVMDQTVVESQKSMKPRLIEVGFAEMETASSQSSDLNAEIEKLSMNLSNDMMKTAADSDPITLSSGSSQSQSPAKIVAMNIDQLDITDSEESQDANPLVDEEQFTTEDFHPENIKFASTQNMLTPKKSRDKVVVMKNGYMSPIKKINLFSKVGQAPMDQDMRADQTLDSDEPLVIDEEPGKAAKNAAAKSKKSAKFSKLMNCDKETYKKLMQKRFTYEDRPEAFDFFING